MRLCKREGVGLNESIKCRARGPITPTGHWLHSVPSQRDAPFRPLPRSPAVGASYFPDRCSPAGLPLSPTLPALWRDPCCPCQSWLYLFPASVTSPIPTDPSLGPGGPPVRPSGLVACRYLMLGRIRPLSWEGGAAGRYAGENGDQAPATSLALMKDRR